MPHALARILTASMILLAFGAPSAVAAGGFVDSEFGPHVFVRDEE